jgi:uncharacterized protein (TIGR02118 family)
VIKVFALIPKLPHVTDEKFHAHWRNPHGELARRITTIRRYSQSHAVASTVSGFAPSAYLGIAEVYFDSVEVAAAMGDDPNYRDYAGADEPNFIDQSRLAFLFCAERVALAGPALRIDSPEIKVMVLLKRASLLEAAAFRDRLANLADLAVTAIPELFRYVECTTLPDMYANGEPIYDAVLEISWSTRAAFERSWSSDGVTTRYLPALSSIADQSASAALLVEPYRVIWP